jgi:hypothetical protein
MSEEEVAELQDEPTSEENTGEVVDEEESTTSEEETEEVAEKPKKPSGVQKRISELNGNWRQEQRRNEQLLAQNLELQRRLMPTQPEVAQVAEQSSVRPSLDDYASYDDFTEALADWKARDIAKDIVNQEFAQRDAAQKQQTEAAEKAQRQAKFTAQVNDFRQRHDDFDEVVSNPDLPFDEKMTDLFMQSERGAELAYALGNNIPEAMRIASLPPTQAAMELGRMEAQMSQLQPRTQSNAPDPIEPIVDGRGGSIEKDPDKMTSSEWLRWRNSQLEK